MKCINKGVTTDACYFMRKFPIEKIRQNKQRTHKIQRKVFISYKHSLGKTELNFMISKTI